jgi:diguanylate cyclase (GGDEF)-like protein
VETFLISVENVIILGAAARNASYPLAARGQTIFGLAPLFAVCLLTPDPYYRVFSVFLLFAYFAANKLITHIYDQHVQFLCTNEENVELVRRARQANEELAAANRRLEVAATTDSLTGIANRRQFDATLSEEVRRAQRDNSDLALLILDIDWFKVFNDVYGHQAGDACLQRVATTLARCVRRPGDLAARYGGEEYVAILPRCNPAQALALAEAVRRAIEALAIPSAASALGIVSVSIGVASFAAGRFRRPEDFIRSADEALYAAKAGGRNCVRVSRDSGEPSLRPLDSAELPASIGTTA